MLIVPHLPLRLHRIYLNYYPQLNANKDEINANTNVCVCFVETCKSSANPSIIDTIAFLITPIIVSSPWCCLPNASGRYTHTSGAGRHFTFPRQPRLRELKP